MNERDGLAPAGETYPTLAVLRLERDPPVERTVYTCMKGHHVIAETPGIQPVRCPICFGPKEEFR